MASSRISRLMAVVLLGRELRVGISSEPVSRLFFSQRLTVEALTPKYLETNLTPLPVFTIKTALDLTRGR